MSDPRDPRQSAAVMTPDDLAKGADAPVLEAPLRDALIEAPEADAPVRSPWRMSWRSFRKHKPAMAGLVILVVFYFVAIFADFISPYDYDNQVRELQWSPPTKLHFSDEHGFSLRPFIYRIRGYVGDDFQIHQEEDRSQRCYMRFFVQGDDHALLGLVRTKIRLFGFDGSASTTTAENGDNYYVRYYLIGSDLSGRDIFSRICYGSRISMTIGLVGASIVFIIGLLVGGISGYALGWVDNLLQRLCEMMMLLPSFYILLMLRFMFPSDMSSMKVYFAVVLIMALIGWAGLARVIRGMVLSIRTQDFVQAGRALGLGHLRIITRHILPNTMGYVIVAVTLSIPSYILGESALSLLGLGIMDPLPSWGNMLQKAMDIPELNQHPWVLWPGLFIFLAVMAFNLVGDGLRDALDPRRLKI